MYRKPYEVIVMAAALLTGCGASTPATPTMTPIAPSRVRCDAATWFPSDPMGSKPRSHGNANRHCADAMNPRIARCTGMAVVRNAVSLAMTSATAESSSADAHAGQAFT